MAKRRETFITKQPGKAIWTLAASIYTILQLPFWLVFFVPSNFRQHPQWTYRQAIMNKLLRVFLYHCSYVEVKTPIQLEETGKFIKIRPSADHVYDGLLGDLDVQPTITGGSWYPSPYEEGDKQRVILHFHGGALVISEGRPGDVDFEANLLVKNIDAKAFFPSYRLASNDHSHFPAALQDAVTAYRYLLDQGISSDRIILSGDSAGGSLVVSLLRHIGNPKTELPAPLAALLFSPWLDIKSARDPASVTGNRNYDTDYLPANFTGWGAQAYIPAHMDINNPHFSPLDHPFKTQTPLWVQVGGLEILYDEGMKFAEVMRGKGNTVEICVEPLVNHDILLVGNLSGLEAEAEHVVKLAGEFLSTVGETKPKGKAIVTA
ncbi:hypothetical protein MMC15_007012 [Xylographa vitiligo]|nr:hypothetical protein [Xylographa vitiligo]